MLSGWRSSGSSPARPALAAAGGATTAPWQIIAGTAAAALAALWAYLAIAARPFVEANAGHPGHDPGGGFSLDFAAPFGATPFADAMRLAEIGLAAAVLLAAVRLFSPP